MLIGVIDYFILCYFWGAPFGYQHFSTFWSSQHKTTQYTGIRTHVLLNAKRERYQLSHHFQTDFYQNNIIEYKIVLFILCLRPTWIFLTSFGIYLIIFLIFFSHRKTFVTTTTYFNFVQKQKRKQKQKQKQKQIYFLFLYYERTSCRR